MTEGLEAFERIKKHTLSYTGDVYKTLTDSREMQAEDLDIIESALKKQEQDEKEHKALEIIKKKRVDVALLIICGSAEGYNFQIGLFDEENEHYKNLTQEEYDFLIEVLNNEI